MNRAVYTNKHSALNVYWAVYKAIESAIISDVDLVVDCAVYRDVRSTVYSDNNLDVYSAIRSEINKYGY